MLRNPIRDAMTAYMQSEHGMVPGQHAVIGAFHVLGRSELYQEWLRSGAPHSAVVSLDRTNLQRSVRDLVAHPIKGVVMHPIEALRALSEFSEAITRVGEYAMERKAGKAPLQAAVASQNVTLPFQRLGTAGRAVNMIVAFWNANVQGADMFARLHIQHPARSAIRGMIGLTVPSLLLYSLNRDDPDYKDVPQWQKDLFWLVPTRGTPVHDKVKFILIPKPFLWGQVYSTVPERAMEWLNSKDPRAFDDLGRTLAEGALPGMLPTAAVPPVEWMTNFNLFTGNPVESQALQQFPPQYRAYTWTSEFSKQTARAAAHVGIQVSPAKLDNAIRGTTGGLGQELMTLSTAAAGKGRAVREPADIPGVGVFFARTVTTQTAPLDRLYKRLDTLRQKQAASRVAQRMPGGPTAGAQALTQEEGAELARLAATARQISEHQRRIRMAETNPNLTADQKEKLVRGHTERIRELARLGKPMHPAAGAVQ
jgi:hypothetical protein